MYGVWLGHGSTLVTRSGLGFVRQNGIDGENGGCFGKIRRDNVLIATPRDYASCHEMKRDKRTRVQSDLSQSTFFAFPYFRSEVRSARREGELW